MERRQIIVFGTIFALVMGVMAIIYLTMFRTDYAVLYENMREADAAEIVAILDQESIEYRLEDAGHRVMVSEGDVSRARVLVAGSGVAMGGVVGFELFNEADMGLTEFAQKVNYQRALQGELARTIMTMEGIGFARVHLSLPERTLFRANQTGPKAAVTLQTKSGRGVDNGRVVGIQQLVSAAVTDLPAHEVAVLDHRGRLLSAAMPSTDAETGQLDERSALEEYYRARSRGVIERLIPGLPFDVRVLAVSSAVEPLVEPISAETAGSSSSSPSVESGNKRNFLLRVTVRTESDLNNEDRDLLRDAIIEAAGLNAGRGDSLRFETGALQQLAPVGSTTSSDALPDEPAPIPGGSSGNFEAGFFDGVLSSALLWPLVGVLGVFGLILLRRRSRMSDEEQQSFADLLSENLSMTEAAAHER